jgi:hypothetical protein
VTTERRGRYEIWQDPDVGDWNVTEHHPDGSEETLAEFFVVREEARAYVANLIWLERVDR